MMDQCFGEPEDTISVQVLDLTYSMSPVENSILDLREVKERSPLPVIRVFGSSINLCKCCVVVHGVYPYFYFRPEDVMDSSFDNADIVHR